MTTQPIPVRAFHTAEEIIEAVAQAARLDVDTILGLSRGAAIVRARRAAARIMRSRGFSFSEIGHALRRDHTSAIDYIARNGNGLQNALDALMQDAEAVLLLNATPTDMMKKRTLTDAT